MLLENAVVISSVLSLSFVFPGLRTWPPRSLLVRVIWPTRRQDSFQPYQFPFLPIRAAVRSSAVPSKQPPGETICYTSSTVSHTSAFSTVQIDAKTAAIVMLWLADCRPLSDKMREDRSLKLLLNPSVPLPWLYVACFREYRQFAHKR